MSELLPNFVAGQWQAGSSAGTPLFDPVLGDELVRVDSTGLDLGAAFTFARERGGTALRALTYGERAEDIFFINSHEQQLLTDPAQMKCLEDEIVRRLEPATTPASKLCESFSVTPNALPRSMPQPSWKPPIIMSWTGACCRAYRS